MSDKLTANELIIGHAQVWLFFVSLIGFVGLLYILVLGRSKMDDASEKLAYTMLGVLGTIVTQQAGYFYARQRPTDGTQPNPTTVITPSSIAAKPKE